MKTRKSWKLGSALAGAILLGALATLPARAQTYDSIIQANSPLDWWRFDETTPSPVVNTVSNLGSLGAAGTGYVVGGVLLGQPGIVGSSALFTNTVGTGSCTARIDIPNNAALNPEPPFSIEFWAQPTLTNGESPDSTGNAAVSSLTVSGTSGVEGARSGYVFYDNAGGWEFRAGGLESYSFVVTAPFLSTTNVFTHIVGTFDGTTAALYINGVLAFSGAATGGPYKPNNFSPTRIGGTCLPGGETGGDPIGSGNRGWSGYIDKFAVYNTILSSNTIFSHYTAGTNSSTTSSAYDALILASSPVGYWNLNEPAYTTPSITNTIAADAGSLDDLGTNTLGALADQPGVPGTGDKAVFYNGALGSLVLDTNPAPVSLAGSNITLAAWINPLSFGYVSDIIAQGFDSTTFAENYLRVGNSYDWGAFAPAPNTPGGAGGIYNPAVQPDVTYYEVGAYDGGPGYISAVFPAPAGDLGHWVFLVGTFDGTNWNLYRNGALVAQFSGAWPDGNPPGPALVQNASDANDPWSVGSAADPNEFFGMFFIGSIAEPAIFAKALDAATISNLYNSVALPPVITQAPVAPSPLFEGGSASLSVWADGPAPLSYQWTSNGAPVVGQTGTNFSLTGLTAAADGTYSVIVSNPNGSVTSSVVLLVTPSLPPAVLGPVTETRWLGSPLTFAPASLPDEQLSFQWYFDGTAISGATQSSYSAPATAGSVGSYTLVLSNSFGVSTSTVATVSEVLTPPNDYVSTILGDHPLSYFRLDESSGTTAYDYAGGDNGTYFGNVTLGVPGYSLVDTDTAASFPGVALSYMGSFGSTEINFYGTNAEFSIEAWANGPATQIGPIGSANGAAVIAKGHAANGTDNNEQFAIAVTSGKYVFFVTDDHEDAVKVTGAGGPDGNWHHLVGVCDYQGLGGSGPSLTLYIDGTNAGTASLPGTLNSGGLINSLDNVSVGAESSEPGPTYDLAYNGTIDEVAIYATNLSALQVSNHYEAAYGPDLVPFIVHQPVSVTNYVTYPATLLVGAAGSTPLSYQWNQNGVPIPGATTNPLVFSSLVSSNAGTYTVGVTNTLAGNVVTGILSAPVTITVLQPPTSPPPISGLVMHLTFDNTLEDATGRGNNATYLTSGTYTTNSNPITYVQGELGEAFSYETDVNTNTFANGGYTNAWYASLGIRPDLQFGANSFTVSMWVQLPVNYEGGDLPFFTDVVGSTFGNPGYCFVPSFGEGGWACSVIGPTQGLGVYGEANSINDGNWHSLIYDMDVVNGATIYLDGKAAIDTNEDGLTGLQAAGNINNSSIATIGQDPTGLYSQAGSAYIDDLGVWNRALTALEAESIYLAAASNQVSFTGATNVTGTFSLAVLAGKQLQLTWSAGSIQAATNLSGPWITLTNTSPFVVSPTNTLEFFRAQY